MISLKDVCPRQVDWVQCDGCELWFHLYCIGLKPEQVSEDEDFLCKNCKPNRNKVRIVDSSNFSIPHGTRPHIKLMKFLGESDSSCNLYYARSSDASVSIGCMSASPIPILSLLVSQLDEAGGGRASGRTEDVESALK